MDLLLMKILGGIFESKVSSRNGGQWRPEQEQQYESPRISSAQQRVVDCHTALKKK